MRVMGDTDLGGGETLESEFDDLVVDDLESRWRYAAVWKGRGDRGGFSAE